MSDPFPGHPLPCENRVYYRPLIPLLLAYIIGILFSDHLPGHLWVGLSGMMVSAAITLRAVFRHSNARFGPLVLFFFLGYISLLPWTPFPVSSVSPNHVSYYVNKSISWDISGTIDDTPVVQDFRTICILNHLHIARPGKEPVPVSGKIRTLVYGNPPALAMGDCLSFNGKIRPFTSFKNPGGFDYARYMRFQGILGNTYTSQKKITITPGNTPLRQQIKSVRKKISDIISIASDGDARAILNALIIGDRGLISPALRRAFIRSGISHILAISGLHIGIIASFSFFLFAWLAARCTPLLKHGHTRRAAAVLSLIPIVIYAMIAGMSPSTQRALIMVGAFLVTFLIQRDHDLINTVAVAAFIILFITPPSLFSISFQLSFAAVLSIIFGLSAFKSKTKSENPVENTRPSRHANKFIAFVLVSALAIIGTAPLTLYYFNQVSLVGLFSNLIFIPVIGFLVIPAGLFSVLIIWPLSPKAAILGLKFCNMVLTVASSWIYKIDGLPFAAIKTVTPSVFEIVCIYLLIGTGLYLFGGRRASNRNQPVRRPLTHEPPFSHLKTALMILGITLLVFCADTCYWAHKRWWKNDLTVSILDVGQGNAALLEMPGGKCAMIDGGGFSDNTIFDMGEKVIAPFLWRKKITTVETVFLTHYDSDHLNGLIYILKYFHVKQVFANHDPQAGGKQDKFEKIIRKRHINYPDFDTFKKNFKISGLRFQIIYPSKNYMDLEAKDGWRNSNNNSMVIRMDFGNHDFLFPGDIMKPAERELIDTDADLTATILMVPHHGSNSSSSMRFLKKIKPTVAVISSGRHNRFGFPSPEVIARYNENNVTILRTDIDGEVTLTTDGHRLKLSPMVGEEITIEK